jgi:uncharacterized hydrophobic protein (TIGR00341 family)
MAQNLLQIVLPTGFDTDIRQLVEEGTHLGSWDTIGEDSRPFHQILVDGSEVQEILDRLESRFSTSSGFSVLLLPMDASLPRPKKEEPPEEEIAEEQSSIKKKRTYHAKVSRETLYSTVSEGVEPDRIFFAMVFLSSLVAAFGLIRNDLAIIIGAMVIAPLLMPNVALALATTLADKDLWRRAIKANLLGMGLALTIAALLGLILAPTLAELTDGEIFKRTEPQLADLLLAIISGVAGTLALTAGLSSTVIGVMVAVALMPPLVTCGILAGAGYWPQAWGAALLLSANVICVNLAGVATFLFMGVRPRTWWESEKAKRSTRRAMILWAVLLLALVGILLTKYR